MKKIVVRVAIALVALVALAVLGLIVKFYALSPKSRPPQAMTAPSTPEAIARGKYLANHVAVCLACHSEIDESRPGDAIAEGRIGSGRDFGDMPGPAHLRAKNLTPDKETGIGAWSDGEIVRAMREGVSRDGRALFPQMPYLTYGHMLGDEDALAIVAYLRTLAPIKNDPGRTEVRFPVSMFVRAAPAPVETPAPPPPPATDKLARGKWLLKVALCNECHDSVNERYEKIPGKALAGGMKFPIPGKGVAIAPNITSDKATGIGSYSDEDLRRVFEEGKNKSGRSLYVMPWSHYKGLTSEDKDALFAALREVAPIANVVPPSEIH